MPRQKKPTDELSLIEKYKIQFKGPVPRPRWKELYPEYANIFEVIYNISHEEIEGYQPTAARDELSVQETKRRVQELVIATARIRRESRMNESTLRSSTENLVFSRFAAEVKCSDCRKSLWISEFTPSPQNLVESANLQKQREVKSPCRCPAESRSYDNFDENGKTFLFRSMCQTTVAPDSDDIIPGFPIPRRQPDRIFGLNKTMSFREYIKNFSNLRHTPITESSNLLYPFIVLEAKCGRIGTGFEGIETQTAFPLWTCLRLQQKLKQHSESSMNPLVWFVSFQSDEWRVAACVPHGEETHIIDLWMGRALSRDGALQLFHIVDYIFHWARYDYRKDVLAALAGRQDRFSRFSPDASSRTSTQPLQTSPKLPLTSLSDSDVTDSEYSPEAGIIDLTMDDVDFQSGQNSSEMSETSSFSEDCSHPWLKWVKPRNEQRWTQMATIRHANMVTFKFKHYTLTNDPVRIRQWLKESNLPSERQVKFLRQITSGLRNPLELVTTTLRAIMEIKNEWLKRYEEIRNNLDSAPVRAWFGFHTYVREDDWQIVRELVCISFKLSSTEALFRILSQPNPMDTALARSSVEKYKFTTDLFDQARPLTGITSLALAMQHITWSLSLRLEEDDQQYSCRWVPLGSGSVPYLFDYTIDGGLDVPPRSGLHSIVDDDSSQMEVSPRPSLLNIEGIISARLLAKQGGILLHMNKGHPRNQQRWCFMVLEHEDFDDEVALGSMLQQAYVPNNVQVLRRYGHNQQTTPEIHPLSTEDHAFLKAWIHDLIG